MNLEKEYIITTDSGGYVETFRDGSPCGVITSIERTQHFLLSEAVALKEKYPSFWYQNQCKIKKISLVEGEEVKIP